MTTPLERCLWNTRGERRLPGLAELDAALAATLPSEIDRLLEFGPRGPLYLLPTKEWIRALAKELERLGVKRVLEIGAGDGFLSACLAKAAPRLDVRCTDSHAWTRATARMSARERAELKGVEVAGIRAGSHVERLEARAAIAMHKPDLVLASWLPPKFALSQVLRRDVNYLFEIGAAGGVTPGAWNWRYAHDLCTGPLEELARCRLDVRPKKALHSRVTLYFGAAHPEHRCERVREGDWLWQFRP